MDVQKVYVEASSKSAFELFQKRYEGREATRWERIKTLLTSPTAEYVANSKKLYCSQKKNAEKLMDIKTFEMKSDQLNALELYYIYPSSGSCSQTIDKSGEIKFRDVSSIDNYRLEVTSYSSDLSYQTQTLDIWKKAYKKETRPEFKKKYKEAFNFLVKAMKNSSKEFPSNVASID